MKTKLLITVICVLALLLSTSTPAYASGDTDATSVAVDVVVARPATFALNHRRVGAVCDQPARRRDVRLRGQGGEDAGGGAGQGHIYPAFRRFDGFLDY